MNAYEYFEALQRKYKFKTRDGEVFYDDNRQCWVVLEDGQHPLLQNDFAVAVGGRFSGMHAHLGSITMSRFAGVPLHLAIKGVTNRESTGKLSQYIREGIKAKIEEEDEYDKTCEGCGVPLYCDEYCEELNCQ